MVHRAGDRVAFPRVRIELGPGIGHHALRERHDDLIALFEEAVTTTDSHISRRLPASAETR